MQAEQAATPDGGLDTANLALLDRAEIAGLAAAARRVQEVEAELAGRGGNVVARLLADADGFYEWDHYPSGDAYDPATESQYFYHAHAADQRFPGEHGHFHTFVRPFGLSHLLPEGEEVPPPTALTHLIGVSIDIQGRATRLFTTNRWVTAERWYPAATAVQLLPHFEMTGDVPAPEVNAWLTALLRLYRSDIAALMTARDSRLAAGGGMVTERALDDRALEVASLQEIDVPARVQAVAAEAARRGL